jgi:hypothetical protein
MNLNVICPLYPDDIIALEMSVSGKYKKAIYGVSATWYNQIMTKWYLGLTFNNILVTTGISTHQSPFIGKPVFGMYLTLTFLKEKAK